MKTRRFLTVFAAVLLLACFMLSASALQFNSNTYVVDDANLFSGMEEMQLSRKAAAISERYDVGVYIITVDDFRSYYNVSSIESFIRRAFDDNHLGLGSDRSAVAFALSLEDRDYAVDTCGKNAKYAFNDTGLDWMIDRFIDQLRNNDFYGAYSTYLTCCEEYLAAAEEGEPVGETKIPSIVAAIPGAIAALLAGLGLAAPMRSANLKHDANEYVVPGSLNLRRRSDMFLHRTVTRAPRQTSSSSSHHSTHSSGGMSSRGGKY